MPRKMNPSPKVARGFTLIELLVVIANLAAMLMPALAKSSSNQPVRHNHKT
ncbi:MAG TPA: hypothetical protein DCQ92_15240 [Verrucomicrobia subdivision 3 bacterium]|nr:hypothetical protein [Limisphaerales bacterium]